ncbi:bifunctional diaminohydroxyphosphoribosylaminopyrimidine deaminase/5-amino-6-(5-phosphoribosylamino)uracil reductase RibD [Fluviispira multicolorata]|nr:bifunctional diaminohydroxyphosphoribosylaminopyrimidine deaminase/5-amino-6-(5-phosphoribosylamino)uracil reductase RibD [Fluviispira multicolorata]
MSLTLRSGFSFGGALSMLFPADKIKNEQSFLENTDEYWMSKALVKSMENASIANPNPSVGCLIVKNNELISSGCTEIWGGRHAESIAFSRLSPADLSGSTVYVTLEPCTHVGKQPPCIELFKNKGIQKVVIASKDPNPLVAGQGLIKLKEMGIECVTGVLINEVQAWLAPFFVQQKHKRPFIALKWAQTLDGCLADDNNGWQWISGENSRKYTHWLRQKYDAILIGVGTLLNDFPSLDIREIQHPNKRNPLKMIYDPFGKIFQCDKIEQEKLKEKTFKEGTKKIIFINSSVLAIEKSKKNEWLQSIIQNKDFLIVPLGEQNQPQFTKSLLESFLGKEIEDFLGRPLQSVLVEGGGRLLSAFIEEKCFDLIHIFIAPFFLGGEKHKLFSSAQKGFLSYPLKEVSTVQRYIMKVQEKLGEDILIELVQNEMN